MIHRRLRILYVDETTGFGGGMVALRNLIVGLNPMKYEAAIVVRKGNTIVISYLRNSLPASVPLYPIGRWDLSAQGLFHQTGERFFRLLAGQRGRAFLDRSRWAFALLADALPAALRMASIAKRWKANAIHTNEQMVTNIAGVMAARLAGIPCFCHNRMWGFSAGVATHLVPRVAHCFAVSEYIKNDMVSRGVPPSLVTVAYDGLDLAFFGSQTSPDEVRKELGISTDRKVVGIFGRLVPWKGHEFFLKALAMASEHDPLLLGCIVGDTSPPGGPFMKQLKALALDLGIQDRVLFIGYRTDVARLISATHITVVPSVEPDPFPAVNLEAMAMSRPVIATRVGGIPEQIKDGENGLLISVGDVEGFAKAILRLSRDSDLARTLGANGRRIVERNFTAQRYAEAVSKEYEKILV